MQGDTARNTGQAVDERRIGNFLCDRARRAGLGKHLEAGTTVPITPGWGFDVLRFEGRLHAVHVDAAALQVIGQGRITGLCLGHDSFLPTQSR